MGKRASPNCRKFHPKLKSPDLFPEKYKSERMEFSTSDLYIYTHLLYAPFTSFQSKQKNQQFFFFFVKPFLLWMVEALDLIPLLWVVLKGLRLMDVTWDCCWDLLHGSSSLARASSEEAWGASAWEEILTLHLRAGMSSSFLTTYPHLRFREFLCES